MNGCEVNALVSAMANVISCNYTPEQIAILAVIFTQLGDALATILAVNEFEC